MSFYLGPYPHKSFLPGSFNRKAPNNQNDLASLLFQVWTSAHINLLLWMRRKNTKFSGTATGKKFSKVARNGQMKLEIVQQQLVSLNRPRTEIVVSSRTEKKTKKIGGKKNRPKSFSCFSRWWWLSIFFWNGEFFWQSRLQQKLKRQQPRKATYLLSCKHRQFFPPQVGQCAFPLARFPLCNISPYLPPHSIKIRN